MKEKNPIIIKLQALLDTGQMTKEKICVAADIRYPALASSFVRPRVSKLVLKSLLWKRIINQEDVDLYNQWLVDHGLYGEKRGGSRGRKKSEKRENPKHKHSDQDSGLKEVGADDGPEKG